MIAPPRLAAASALPRAAVLAAALLLAGTPAAPQEPETATRAFVRVPLPPASVKGDDGRLYLAHELHLLNGTGQPWRLAEVEVAAGDGRTLQRLDGADLEAAFRRIGPPEPEAPATGLAGGRSAVVYLWVPLPEGPAPESLRHRLTLQPEGDAPAQTFRTVPVPLGPPPVRVGAPLRGGPWLAANGPSNTSGHRRTIVPLDGRGAIAQRYAVDWVVVGDDGRTFAGDPLDNAAYHAWGREAIAVADATVAAHLDGVPENVPGADSRAVPIDMDNVGGNYVTLDLGDGRFAFYAHLQPGSLRVRTGDRVRKGQVLGLVGNSGNSTEPHLHFHVTDGTSKLGAEGLPYLHEAFTLLGRCDTAADPDDDGGGLDLACDHRPPTAVRDAIPLRDSLVRFPQ